MPQVRDSMVIHFEDEAGGMGQLVLLIAPTPHADPIALTATVRTTLRNELSPRHAPDTIVFVPSVPRTSTGKRLEIPLKRAVQGMPDAIDSDVLVHPEDVGTVVKLVAAAVGPDAA